MQGVIKTLNQRGHTAVKYDTESGSGVEEAKEAVTAGNGLHSAFFDGQTKERIRRSDPDKIIQEHEEVIVVRPMAGG